MKRYRRRAGPPGGRTAPRRRHSPNPPPRGPSNPSGRGNWQRGAICAMQNPSFTVSRQSPGYNANMDGAAAVQACEKYNVRARAEGWPSVCDAALDFHRVEFRVLIATWRSFATQRLPSRRDFTPRSLKALLRNVVIYERVTNGSVRY